MYCSKCGKELADGILYCHHCGNQISQNPVIVTPKKKGGCGQKIGAAFVGVIMFGAVVNIAQMANNQSNGASSQSTESTSNARAQEKPKPKTHEVKRASISEF